MNKTHNFPKLALLIPCYNCGAVIDEVVKKAQANEHVYRILLINDGSDDETTYHIELTGVENISWFKNRGKGHALIHGFKYLLDDPDWDALITMDSDGQHAPEDLSKFINRYQENRSDIIAGRRKFEEADAPWLRRWANQVSSRLIARLFRCPIQDIQCGYRLFSRKALKELYSDITSQNYAIETEMILNAQHLGMYIDEVDVQCIYDEDSSKRSAWKPLLDSYRITRIVFRYLFK